MENGEIFASEGGYRLCKCTWAGGPIMDQSPWYPTLEKAQEAQARHHKRYDQTPEDNRAACIEQTGYTPEELDDKYINP